MLKPEDESKQWMHTHSPNKSKKFKQILHARQKADGNCLLGQQPGTTKFCKTLGKTSSCFVEQKE
jgi:hypothetical protein